MSAGDQEFSQLLQAVISTEIAQMKMAEQTLLQMKKTQPALLFSKLMDTYNNVSISNPAQQQLSLVLISNFLKKDSHLLTPEMRSSIAEFALNAFPTAGQIAVAKLAEILFSIYQEYKYNSGGAATAHTQQIEELMMTLLTSPDQNSQLKGVRLAECFFDASDDVKIPEELKKNVANELVNLLHATNFKISGKAFEVLALYGENAEGKHVTALFKKAVEGMINVLKQAFAEDASHGEELLLNFANVLEAQKKSFRPQVDAILGAVLGFVKDITTETMESQGLSIFESLIELIPGKKGHLFFEFVRSVLDTIQNALNETTFVYEDKEKEKYITTLEEILVSCTEVFAAKNDTVISKLEEISNMLLKSTDWKNNVAGLILLATIYRVSEDSKKDTKCLKICLEWIDNKTPQIRFYAYNIVQAVMYSESTKTIKKHYKELLDKCLEGFDSGSKGLKLSVARILQSFFSQKENLKIAEEDLELYVQKACVIAFDNIKDIDSDSMIYLELLDAVFDSETAATPEQKEFLNSAVGSLLQMILQLLPGLSLNALGILLKLIAVLGNDQTKKEVKTSVLAGIQDLCKKSSSEFYIDDDLDQCLDANEHSNGIVTLWKNYIQIYGKESFNELKDALKYLNTCLVTSVNVQFNSDSDENDVFSGPKELNLDVPVNCVDSLKGFVNGVIKYDTERLFALEIESMLFLMVSKAHEHTCYDYDTTESLKELCTQVYEWDHQEDPGRALSFISTIVIKLTQSFKKLIQRKDPYDVSAVVIFVNHIVKTVKDLPKQTLLEILDAFPGEILKECELRLEDCKDDEDDEEEEEDEDEGTDNKKKTKQGKGGNDDDDDKEENEDEESKNSEDESFDEEDEPAGDKEYVWDLMIEICVLWGQLLKRLQGEASELAEYIVKSVILTWLNKKGHYKERSVGYHSMFAILDNMEPQFIPSGFWTTAQKLYQNSTVDHQGERHNCAFGLGVLAQKAPTMFVKVGEMVLKRLFEMTEDKKRSTTGMKIYNKYIDNVYSAIGKVFANNPQFMKDDYVENWLKYLPLKYDDDESKIMFSEMCKMAENKECVKGLMGKNGQFYDLVIKKFDESIESEFCDRETGNKLSMAKSKLISQKGQN